MGREDDFRIAEFNALRGQLIDRVKAIETAGVSGAGISGAFWAWVLSAKSLPEVPTVFYFLPAMLVAILALRLVALDGQRRRIAAYIVGVEAHFNVPGWETAYKAEVGGIKRFFSLSSIRSQQYVVLLAVLFADVVGALLMVP